MPARPEKHQANLRKNTLGGVVGNVLEWYDFAVFGFFAPIIGSRFFPAEDKFASLIYAFGVFAAGYMMRPLGGIIFGHIGDKFGRKKALMISMMLMAIPTTVLGLLPTYQQVGITASVLLILLRLIQGVSVGGELIGSVSFTTEIAPQGRRGLFGSFSTVSAIGGIMLGSLVAAIIHAGFKASALLTWGWRLPFIAGLLIGLFGLWLRRGMTETPDFEQAKDSEGVEAYPVLEVLKHQLGKVVHLALLMLCYGGGFYMLFVWWPSYLTTMVKPAVPHALAVNTICMALLILLTPLCGHLSDKVGRRLMWIIGNAGLMILAIPLYVITDHGVFVAAMTAQLAAAFTFSILAGSASTLMVELFPTRTRYSGAAMGYNITLALIGGTTPLLCTWLVEKTGYLASPAYYLIALAAVSLIAALKLPKGTSISSGALWG